MPLVGSGLLGGPGGGAGGGAGAAGVAFSEIAMAAYRIAGIVKAARVGPNEDLYAEAVPAYNRMAGSWSCERPKIFTVALYTLPLPTSKVCTVGPGADFDMPRPVAIQNGVVVLPDGTRLKPMAQGTADDWASLGTQDEPGAYPTKFYPDGSIDPETGYGRIYLHPQAQAGLSVDWYVWQPLPTVTSKDDVLVLSEGYEEAVVYNLADRLASLNPLEANMPEESRRLGRKALAVIHAKNSKPPSMTSDYPGCGGGGSSRWWITGGLG